MSSSGQHRFETFKTNFRTVVATLALTLLLALVFAITPAAHAQTYQTIHNFTGQQDGATPYTGVAIDPAGNLYGTTYSGGAGYGTVYKLKRSGSNWILSLLYTFAGGSDGANPTANVTIAPNGVLYGTTYYGGGGCSGSGCGTVFSLRPPATFCRAISCPWTETVLYRFRGEADGEHPAGNLAFDSTGNIYGTTYGDPVAGIHGTVFKISSGVFTTLYSFCFQTNCPDGTNPYAGLVLGNDGNFYGTTVYGGANDACGGYDSEPGCGTVFQITPSGGFTSLYSFCSLAGCADGEIPVAALIQGTDGNFYGTTYTGTPTIPSYGVAFKITPTGTLSVMYSFCSQGNCTDGAAPFAALFQASDGNFYGTTKFGGANDNCVEGGSQVGCGTLFKLTAEGALTTLYSFCTGTNCPDGQWPLGGVVQDSSGNFYGTASAGGADGYGDVWEITP